MSKITTMRKVSMIFAKITNGLIGHVLTPQDYINEAKSMLESDLALIQEQLVDAVAAISKLARHRERLVADQESHEQAIRAALKEPEKYSKGYAESQTTRLLAVKAAITQLDVARNMQKESIDRAKAFHDALSTKIVEVESQIVAIQTTELISNVTGSTVSNNWDKNSYKSLLAEANNLVNDKFDKVNAQVKVNEMVNPESTTSITSQAVLDELERIRSSM